MSKLCWFDGECFRFVLMNVNIIQMEIKSVKKLLSVVSVYRFEVQFFLWLEGALEKPKNRIEKPLLTTSICKM